MTPEEERLFRELAARGVKVAPELLHEQSGPRNTTPWDVYGCTSPVSPSSPHPQIPVDYAGGTSSGRGNPSERSGGINMPPKVPGASAPGPTQATGSNLPGSLTRQLPPITLQYPTQVVTIPTGVFASSKEQTLKENPPYPSLVPVNGRQGGTGGVSDTTPGHGNVHPPFGRLGPRTPKGADANPLSLSGDSGIAQQVKTPIVTQERSWVDSSRPSASRSPLIQGVPASFQTGSTTLQSPVATPQAQSAEYPRAPGTFNAPTPLQPKRDASDSAGILQPNEFPPGFLSAGQRPKKVVSQIVRDESTEGE